MAKILVIRRDNIGDLVCTTPLLAALRAQLPEARIVALVTRYNEAVLVGNPDIDAIYSYTKAKHRQPGESRISVYSQRLRTIIELRRQDFDWVLLPGGAQGSSLRFARWIDGRRLIVRGEEDTVAGLHEVEQTCHLLPRMGLDYATPPPRVLAAADEVAKLRGDLATLRATSAGPLIGVHISARKPPQRWPTEHFSALIRHLHQKLDAAFLLLWAPGQLDNPLHPGDDEKATAIIAGTAGLPILPIRTARLEELIAAISTVDLFVCSDGGAMHLAAGLGKSIVCLFGNSNPRVWHPWGVAHRVLQPPGEDVVDLTVGQVGAAVISLASDLRPFAALASQVPIAHVHGEKCI